MEWISIKDRLPGVNTDVLAYARAIFESDYQIIKCIYGDRLHIRDSKKIYEFYETCGCDGYEREALIILDVSHWMPLPEPPKEVE